MSNQTEKTETEPNDPETKNKTETEQKDQETKQDQIQQIDEEAEISETTPGGAENTRTNVKPRGRPKSGRSWKQPDVQRITSKKTKRKVTYEQRMKEKEEKKKLLEFQQGLKRKREEEIQEQREKRKEKRRRKELNEYKSSTKQTVKNLKKLKSLSKKERQKIKFLTAGPQHF
eukprot:TRINITY_DN1054_c0_g1_i1.p1 TRINITY_DN1054_c0_g1~~TRINITY_DN1054_c0_g1_i1.p1  ORF type:complete len:185 (-),score=56.14 TRINITY_DN1054_c0_g1_i1:61-579(-)